MGGFLDRTAHHYREDSKLRTGFVFGLLLG